MAKDTAETETETEKSTESSGTLIQLYLGLVWLGTSMWTAHATLTSPGAEPGGAFGAAAGALPGVVASTLVAGAGIGHAAGSKFRTAGGRLLGGLGIGLVFGLIAGALIRFGYGSEQTVMVFAITVGVSSVIGGAFAALPGDVLDAALWATSWVFFAGLMFGIWQPNLITVLGGGPNADPAAQATADARFVLGQSILTGLFAALNASRWLGFSHRPLFGYVVAGVLPGVLLVIAEFITRAGGASLVNLVTGFTGDEPALVELTDAARLRHALIVLAVGGVATVLFGLRKNQKARAEERREREKDLRAEEEERRAEEAERRAEANDTREVRYF